MSEPMSDERLADIRVQVSDGAGAGDIGEQWAWGIAAELLAEVDRLRAHNTVHGYAAPITFTEDENGHRQPQWPSRP